MLSTRHGISLIFTVEESVMMTSRSTKLRSSRVLPGHSARSSFLYNSFETTVDGKKDTSSYTNKLKYLESLGYFVETVTNAEDYTLIDKAITRAKESGKPSIIEIKTMIAIGTSMQASPKGHEYVISENDLALVKEKMSITQVPYHISASSYNEFKNILEKNNHHGMNNIYPDSSLQLNRLDCPNRAGYIPLSTKQIRQLKEQNQRIAIIKQTGYIKDLLEKLATSSVNNNKSLKKAIK